MGYILRNQAYEDAVKVFQKMKNQRMVIDRAAYSNAVRAFGHCGGWEDVLACLNDARSSLTADDCIHVANSALTNLKYLRKDMHSSSSNTNVSCIFMSYIN